MKGPTSSNASVISEIFLSVGVLVRGTAGFFLFPLVLVLTLGVVKKGNPLLEKAGTNLGKSITAPRGWLILVLRASMQFLQIEARIAGPAWLSYTTFAAVGQRKRDVLLFGKSPDILFLPFQERDPNLQGATSASVENSLYTPDEEWGTVAVSGARMNSNGDDAGLCLEL